jgi:ABC-type polysaccharide/polyol phosphate transport system ATPase subunit
VSLLILFEYFTFNFKLEDDVANEFSRIKNSDLYSLSKQQPLIVNNLLMEYKKKKEKFVAVNHLSFGVQQGECFGLLGKNND